MNISDFDYDLPSEYIAQEPVEPRDAANLMVLNRRSGVLEHSVFRNLGRYLRTGDLLVLNETRVIPARLFARKIPSGGRVEILLLRRQVNSIWETLVGGKRLNVGMKVMVEGGPEAEILADLGGPRRQIQFSKPIEPYLEQAGHVPLPPYIHKTLNEAERYQTVYANKPGSAAAPTAGLHFTPQLIKHLEAQGIGFAKVTLHIGLDTFAPVTEKDPREHKIHTEWCQVEPQVARKVNQVYKCGGRIIAVGTTCVRTLESAHRAAGRGDLIAPIEGPTGLYILPGYEFKVVDGMVTNFHLPRSTLIMLVSAFAGREQVFNAYRIAIQENYRFYSFGDAMLIL